MHENRVRSLALLIALVSMPFLSSCVSIPYGDRVDNAPDPQSFKDVSRPIVWTCSMDVYDASGQLHENVAEALGTSSRYVDQDFHAQYRDLSESDQLAFGRLNPRDPDSYERIAAKLPPHYLVKEKQVVVAHSSANVAGGVTGTTVFALSLFPMFPFCTNVEVTMDLFAVDGDSSVYLTSEVVSARKGHLCNYWASLRWPASYFPNDANNVYLYASFVAERSARESLFDLEFEDSVLVRVRSGNFRLSDRVVLKREASGAGQDLEELLQAVVVLKTAGGVGSGFFVNDQGLLVTNAHVVDEQESVTVKLHDNSEITGSVVAKSAPHDLALVKVNLKDVPHLTLALSGGVRIGDEVFVLGAPQGLQASVSKGIVSAIREFETLALLQTDAAINPGNSGGPLVDANTGLVVGVNSLTFAKSQSEGLGFAVGSSALMSAFGEVFDVED